MLPRPTFGNICSTMSALNTSKRFLDSEVTFDQRRTKEREQKVSSRAKLKTIKLITNCVANGFRPPYKFAPIPSVKNPSARLDGFSAMDFKALKVFVFFVWRNQKEN